MKKTAVIIGSETTGIDPLTSEIIEIGLMEITFDDEDYAAFPRPSIIHSELQQP